MFFSFNFFQSSPSYPSPNPGTHPHYTDTAYPPALSQYLPPKRKHHEMSGQTYWAHPEGPLKPSFGDYLSSYSRKLRRRGGATNGGVRLGHDALQSKRGSESRRHRNVPTSAESYSHDHSTAYDQEIRPYQPYKQASAPLAQSVEPQPPYYSVTGGYYGVRERERQKARRAGYSAHPPASAYYMGTAEYPTLSTLGSQPQGIQVIPAYIVDHSREDTSRRRKLRRVGKMYSPDYY